MNNLNIPNVFEEEFQVTMCSRQQTKADCSSREKANAFSAKHLLTISTETLFLAMMQELTCQRFSDQLFFPKQTPLNLSDRFCHWKTVFHQATFISFKNDSRSKRHKSLV